MTSYCVGCLVHSESAHGLVLDSIILDFRNSTGQVQWWSVGDWLFLVRRATGLGPIGPLFFSLYTTDVFHLVEQQQFQILGYADDLQIYDHILPSNTDAVGRRFAACVEDVMTWMASNRLKLNSSENEIIWLGSATTRLGTCSTKPISIAGNDIRPVNNVRNLGVIFDSALSFKLHVSSVAQIRQIYALFRNR